jgi:predicted ATPase/DNA-binding CsgD family transcriptional regulator
VPHSRLRHHGNLPAELTTFVGRRAEIAEVKQLLSRSRLVTLTGLGGVGKTRLALRVAGQARRSFADGVWLVELAGLQDPELVPESVASALGISGQTARDQVEVLGEFLADRQLLLVLDNCEQLLPAVSILVVELLEAASGLRVLATSREALLVPAEYLYPVAPLPVPAVDGRLGAAVGARYAALALFAERAAAVVPGFVVSDDNAALVAGVCQRLDGIPLAIELAAVRLRALSLAQLAERLDDRFRLLTTGYGTALPRHQTLRAAVDWSFELCTKPERLLWMRSSVFAGSFDLEAAEQVCGGEGLPPEEVLEALTGLVDKSVLVPGIDRIPAGYGTDRRRYRLLDTLGQFGLDRLRDPAMAHHRYGVDEALLRRRHRDFYLALAQRFNADWFGPRQTYWSRRMRADLPNRRGALGFCLDTGEARTGLRLAGALDYLWRGCGEIREGRYWLERTLAADPAPSRERLPALVAYGKILARQGEPRAAIDRAREGVDLAHQFPDPVYLSATLEILGISLVFAGEPGLPTLQEAVARATDLGAEHPAVAFAKTDLALAELHQGVPARADAALAEAQAICRAHGDQWWLASVLNVAAIAAVRRGDMARAGTDGREALRMCRALHDWWGTTAALEFVAWAAAAAHEHPRAARLLGVVDHQWRATGGSPFEAGQLLLAHNDCADAARRALGPARFDTEYLRGAGLSLDDAIGYALGEDQPPAEPVTGQATGTPVSLTRRETEVAALVAEGLTNRQIAVRLVLSPRIVESHIDHILAKLGFTTRTQLVAWTVETPHQGGDDRPA